jgi:adenine-specific DNA-methyltransferase
MTEPFENLLIQGENLAVLTALEGEYAGKVKCIYIDPPYNTKQTFSHYKDNQSSASWLDMMRDRLVILHRLLRVDGTIWISIDDDECHYLKVLCDEIFGRKNFVANVVWEKKYAMANDVKGISDCHDFILVYSKDVKKLNINLFPREERHNKAYKNPDNDPRGPWMSTPLHAKSGSSKGSHFSFTFVNGTTWSPPKGTYPRFSLESLTFMDKNNEIWFGRAGNAIPSRKTFLSQVKDGVVAKSMWLKDEVGHNHEAKTEAKFFNSYEPFPTPKPERLIQRIIHLATHPGDLVLDCFAGSGTTGAVAHKMGRRWIMIEMGEHAKTHIIPRLEKVIAGSDPGGITKVAGWKGGGSFKFQQFQVTAV